ncbi:hypothetical protein D3C78_1893290 [compost metagenome]
MTILRPLSDTSADGAASWSRRLVRTWLSKSEIFAEVSVGMSPTARVVAEVTRPLASMVTFV